MDGVRSELGFDETERERIGALYWEAFGGKFRRAFRDDGTGRRIVTAALRSDRMLVARSDGAVVGACGFTEGGRGAVELTWAGARAILPIGASLRALLVLGVLARRSSTTSLVLDGICVASEHRGSGIGSALLDAATAFARSTGRASVRLSVIDTNPRAEALYRRRGFTAVGTGSLGILEAVYGFDRYTVMERTVR